MASYFGRFLIRRTDFRKLYGRQRRFYSFSAKRKTLGFPFQPHFTKTFFRRHVEPGHMPQALSEVASKGQLVFLNLVHESVSPLLGEALTRWTTLTDKEKRQQVYHTTENPLIGHFRGNVCFEEVTNVREHLANPQLFRIIAGGGFPGGVITVTPEILARLGAVDRDMSGVRGEEIWKAMPDIVKHAGEQFDKKALMEGYHLIGAESVIFIPLHAIGEVGGLRMQAFLALTTNNHRMDGGVIWLLSEVPGQPNHVMCCAIQVGEHPVKFGVNFGDRVNVEIAPMLFKTAFRRGAILFEHRETLMKTVGEKRFSSLLLDPELFKEFRRLVGSIDWGLNVDAALLGVTDKLAGILALLRAFAPNTDAPIELDELEKVLTPKELEALVKRAVERSRQLGDRLQLEYVPIGSGEKGLLTEDQIKEVEDQVRDVTKAIEENAKQLRDNEEARKRGEESRDERERRRLEEEHRVLDEERRRLEEHQRRLDEDRRRLDERRREEERRRPPHTGTPTTHS